jgi:ribosomal protein S25
MYREIILSLVAALALPVVGLVSGRVVGDFFLREDMIGWIGAVFGVLVYALALGSSYSHLRYYYRRFEPPGVRASWALALAIEVATFYMSFAYVVIQSPWAFWGSLIGAFVVFWGNFFSMYDARKLISGAVSAPINTIVPEKQISFVPHQPMPVQNMNAMVEETEVSEVRQSVRTIKTKAQPSPGGDQELDSLDRQVLALAATEEFIGPSVISRRLTLAKSSAASLLRRLEKQGLLMKVAEGYRLSTKAGQVIHQATD